MRPLLLRLPLILALPFALSFATPARAQTVDLSRSEITFGFKQENVPGSGKFRKFTGQVNFDVIRPEATRARIEVDATSVDLGDAGWNNEIQGESWFNTKQFPKSVFVVAGARALGGDRFESPAKFTLKGLTRDVTVSFTAKPANGGTLLEGSVPLKRNEFKIGDGPWADTSVVANEVAIRFRVFLTK